MFVFLFVCFFFLGSLTVGLGFLAVRRQKIRENGKVGELEGCCFCSLLNTSPPLVSLFLSLDDLLLSLPLYFFYSSRNLPSSFPLSLSLSVSVSLALRPASHRNVSRGTPGETNWIKRVQSSTGARLSLALSQTPSLRPLSSRLPLHSPSHSSVSCSTFSLCLSPPGLPLSSLLSCKSFPFRCSFSSLCSLFFSLSSPRHFLSPFL